MSFGEAIKHLLRIVNYDQHGNPYYPFVEHPMFPLWALNVKHRHQAIKNASIFLQTNEKEAAMTFEELQKEFDEEKLKKSVTMKKIHRRTSTIHGTPAYWYKNSKELQSLFREECGTWFITMSLQIDGIGI